MAFNLKLVLKALLFSSNQPLTIKDIQAVFTRFHEKAQVPASLAEGGDAAEVPADDAEVAAAALNPVEGSAEAGIVEGGALSLTPEDPELYSEVPALITSTQIREAMDALAAELRAANDIYLLIDGASGYRLVTHPRFARWIRILRDEPPPVKLSQSALETLAVVAYRQPVAFGAGIHSRRVGRGRRESSARTRNDLRRRTRRSAGAAPAIRNHG